VPVFVEATVRYCPDCGRDAEFERPPCQDGHAGDCPEWCCVDCGSAVVIGVVVDEVVLQEVRGAA
jgi:hypothetical protein